MRESKFRVWCKEKNEWEKDSVVLFPDGRLGHWLGNRFISLRQENHILVFFTGLFDKNGKEIWEGDIVECTSELILINRNIPTGKMVTKRCSIEYQADRAMFGRKSIPDGHFEPWSMTQEQMTEFYIVIGNIYKNPTLLEQN